MKVDISNCRRFTRGVATFEHLSTDPVTGLQAWRRSYPMEPGRDRVEVFYPIAGKYYPGPEDGLKVRQIPADDARLREKILHYQQHGIDDIFPGDEKKSIYEENEE